MCLHYLQREYAYGPNSCGTEGGGVYTWNISFVSSKTISIKEKKALIWNWVTLCKSGRWSSDGFFSWISETKIRIERFKMSIDFFTLRPQFYLRSQLKPKFIRVKTDKREKRIWDEPRRLNIYFEIKILQSKCCIRISTGILTFSKSWLFRPEGLT